MYGMYGVYGLWCDDDDGDVSGDGVGGIHRSLAHMPKAELFTPGRKF